MRVQDLISTTTVSCGLEATLNDAARLMWEHDCGALPVIASDRRLADMITDRDVCMAAYTSGQALSTLRVADVMAKEVISCSQTQDINQAERTLAQGRVRRAPVVDGEGRLIGIVTLNDIIRSASHPQAHKHDLSSESVVQTLAAISAPRARLIPRDQGSIR